MNAQTDQTKTGCSNTILRVLATGLLLGLLVFVGFLTLFMENGFIEQVRLLTGIVGYYTIALGLISDSRLLRSRSGLVENMTSSRALEFISGNFAFLGVIFVAWAAAIGPRKTRLVPGVIAVISRILLLTLIPWLLLYSLFHIAIIMPLAYLGFLVSTAVVENLASTPQESQMGSDPVKVKAFVVGIPSAILSLMAWTAGFFAAF